MALEFFIVGGYIKVPRDIFIKEMLIKDSILRSLLKWRSTSDFKGKHPNVSEPMEDGTITISYSSADSVSVGEDVKEFMKRLKSRYKGKVKGWVACTGTYECYGGVYNISVDLNSDDDEVTYL